MVFLKNYISLNDQRYSWVTCASLYDFNTHVQGRGGVVVSAVDFRSEGRWFDAQSLPSCCFLQQETLHHIVTLHPGV